MTMSNLSRNVLSTAVMTSVSNLNGLLESLLLLGKWKLQHCSNFSLFFPNGEVIKAVSST